MTLFVQKSDSLDSFPASAFAILSQTHSALATGSLQELGGLGWFFHIAWILGNMKQKQLGGVGEGKEELNLQWLSGHLLTAVSGLLKVIFSSSYHHRATLRAKSHPNNTTHMLTLQSRGGRGDDQGVGAPPL